MGADLYRDDFDAVFEQHAAERTDAISRRDLAITKEERERLQGEVDRVCDLIYATPYYFRDSYNNSSLFWKLDLSWWQDLNPLFGPNGDGICEKYTEGDEEYDDHSLHPAGIVKLEKIIRERAELLAYNIRDLPDEHDELFDKRYYLDRYDQFLDFLRKAAEGNHTIGCSL